MLEAYEGQKDSADKGLLPDGRRLWVFSQSKLKQLDVCPERGRRTLLGIMPDSTTDSTALGIAAHGAIELCIAHMIEGQGPWALTDMVDVGIELFNEAMAEPDARWVKYKRAETLHAQLERCITTWYVRVRPTLRPLAVEQNFGPLTIYQDLERVVQVRGQIDYIDEIDGLADWKTAGRPWEPWEHQRWDMQPTMYTWAVEESRSTIGPVPSAAEQGDMWDDHPWTWHVFHVDGGYQKIETTRTKADWDWLAHRCAVIAKSLEADLEEWPKNDASALCSPKWCGAWDTCRAPFFGDGLPVRITPARFQKDTEL